MNLSRNDFRGFSLIELTIVLVVIGLVAGGLVVGQTMIRNAQLQTVLTDYAKYKLAVLDFKKQYNGLPGDIIDATDFWDTGTNCGTITSSGTCDGDGDGQVRLTPCGASCNGETVQFWRHLALAGRISGSYTGTAGPAHARQLVARVNVPAGQLVNSIWEANYNVSLYSSSSNAFDITTGNFLRIGGATTSALADTPILAPEDAYKLDSKADDGFPGRGTITSTWSGCTNAATNADTTATYNRTNTALECTLFFTGGF